MQNFRRHEEERLLIGTIPAGGQAPVEHFDENTLPFVRGDNEIAGFQVAVWKSRLFPGLQGLTKLACEGSCFDGRKFLFGGKDATTGAGEILMNKHEAIRILIGIQPRTDMRVPQVHEVLAKLEQLLRVEGMIALLRITQDFEEDITPCSRLGGPINDGPGSLT